MQKAKVMTFYRIAQIGNMGLLLLWHFVHVIINLWYFALGLGQTLESYLISRGLLKRYNSLDSNRVRYLAIVVDSKEADQTLEVIKLLKHLQDIGIKHVCLYDPKGLLKKSKEGILEKLTCAKLYEDATESDSLVRKYTTLEFASFSDGKKAVSKAANYLFKKNYLCKEQTEFVCTESHIDEALKAIGCARPDPDLLLVYGPARCHLGFPAWRLRYTEIVHMGPLKSMKFGSLIKAIYNFTKVHQNYGT
ncbi:Ditrans,polycis-polyprenyl diphosphate synthase ((2E,6E)-farnesyldiphosphate specific) [Heracleum sosnowskyi]|uniref:ditrans,polycis-polyprenyl diphosphate synthase [(2E,6E)-farnesyldiphosphate specific] n=1 Tax=Heracleum sosnowskyi TaxID=360622 RepID=A0AAD8H2V8_9APIA|nr:Ditrans,polycis-polyprenyl diphosphate synthase ((2E,6E)-farnesyldiphosphate specific) [Heracleum sosnowskyi]